MEDGSDLGRGGSEATPPRLFFSQPKAVSHQPWQQELALRLLADQEAPTRGRHALRGWLSTRHLPESAVEDILLAGTELVANAVDHAYARDCPGPVELTARAWDGWLALTVADIGKWRPPPADPGFRGHGLRMVNVLARHVVIDHSGVGTNVTALFHNP
jgi:anti-sigma regulatory factor (Ser/Thr protein kinase)